VVDILSADDKDKTMSDHHHTSPIPKDEKKHVFDNPRNVKRAIYYLCTVCVVALLLDFVVHRHIEHSWETLFGFYAIYGFSAYVLLVLIAREMRKVVMRKEDYYDD